MIESIHLRNFEGHKNTLLELTKGINIITGESDNGKSSIIRSLYWVKDNRPAKADVVSFWNRDKKGNPVKPTFVRIKNKEKTIARINSDEINGYEIGETKLEAVGQNVPDDVKKKLNLSEVNIQYQFDRPFLLADSPTEVAKFFNKIIRLDIIDKVQSKAELTRKRVNTEINNAETRVKELKRILDSFDWVDDAENAIEKLEKVENKIASTQEAIGKIQALLADISSYKRIEEEAEKLSALSSLTEKIDELTEKIKKNTSESETIHTILSEIQEKKRIVEEAGKLSSLINITEQIDEYTSSIKEMNEKIKKVEEILENIKENNRIIEEAENKIKEIQKTLPDVCPLCGSAL